MPSSITQHKQRRIGEVERSYHTAAGLVLNQLGHLPAIGESFDHQGWRFEFVDLDGRRIDKILARRIAAGRRRAAV
jgi:putative hemolysin